MPRNIAVSAPISIGPRCPWPRRALQVLRVARPTTLWYADGDSSVDLLGSGTADEPRDGDRDMIGVADKGCRNPLGDRRRVRRGS